MVEDFISIKTGFMIGIETSYIKYKSLNLKQKNKLKNTI